MRQSRTNDPRPFHTRRQKAKLRSSLSSTLRRTQTGANGTLQEKARLQCSCFPRTVVELHQAAPLRLFQTELF